MRVASALPWVDPLWQRLTGQIASQRLGHAQLVTGQEGIGKRVLLREFAQLLLCDHGSSDSPCGQCSSCHLFNAGSHPDLLMVEPEDGSSQIKIEQVRQVTDFVNTTAQQSQSKVVLLGPAEAMNVNASNALLKSLEEPVSKVNLLLYSHQPSALLATIRSRCQQHKLSPPGWADGLNWLQQNSDVAGLDELLRLAKGAPLKALSMSNEEGHVQFMQFCQDLQDLALAKVSWALTATKWKNWNIGWLLDWFYELALDAAKTHAKVGVSQLSLQPLADLSERIGSAKSAQELQAFSERVLEAQKHLQGQGNPNPIMLIETLVFDWLAMLRQS